MRKRDQKEVRYVNILAESANGSKYSERVEVIAM